MCKFIKQRATNAKIQERKYLKWHEFEKMTSLKR